MNYSLIIPIFNEQRTLPTLIDKLSDIKSKSIEVIFIDDGSSDGTKKILSKLNKIRFIRNNVNIGKSASIVKALNEANGKYIILFDGDLEISPEEINKLIKAHNKNKDLIIKGIRLQMKGNISLFDIGNKFLNYFFNLLYKSSFKDIFCCLIIIDKSLMSSFNIKSKKFGIETEIMANIVIKRLSYKEIGINYVRRHFFHGKKLNFLDVYEILKIMFLKRMIRI